MAQYKHILVGLDLSEESTQVMAKAAEIASTFSAQISLIHIIEPLSFSYGGDIPMDLSEVQAQIQNKARERMSMMAEKFNIPQANLHLLIGHPVVEIQNCAKECNADLIITGTHGKKGLALLLGSTANGVLHGAECDVLAVRIKDVA